MTDTTAQVGPSSVAERWLAIRGPALTLALAFCLGLLSHTAFGIASPAVILVVSVAYSTFLGGRRAGFLSAAIAIGYCIYAYSTPGQLFHYTEFDLRRLLVVTVAAPIMVLIVAHLKRRIDRPVLDERVARAEAGAARERIATILESIGEAFFTVDHEWRFTYANQHAERLVQRRSEALLGRRLWDELPHAEGSSFYLECHRAARDNVPVHFEQFYSPLDAWFDVRAYPSPDGLSVYLQDVTARKRSERALGESEVRFRLLVESVRDYAIFMLDPEGHVASWNAGAERIKGYRPDEILGQHFSLFYEAEDVARGKPAWELKVASTEGRVEDEGWRVRKDGSRFWANVVITALRDEAGRLLGFGKVTRDLTERRRAEEELRHNEARLAGIIASATDAIISVDAAQRVIVFNAAAERMFRCPASMALGQPLEQFIPERFRRAHAEHVRAFGRTGVTSRSMSSPGALVALRADGEEFPIEATISQVDTGGEKLFSVIIRDVTERKQVEAERAHLLAETEAAARRSAFLAEASSVLASSLDREIMLSTVAHQAVPNLADWCIVDVREHDGRLRRIAVAHADPNKLVLAQSIRDSAPDFEHLGRPVVQVLGSGKAIFLPEAPGRLEEERAREAEHSDILRALGLRSFICAPLVARGRTLGALSLATAESGRRYETADLELAEELARRAAVALDNAQLYEAALAGSKAKSDFLAVMSHELRTPLNAIIGYAELLRLGVPEPIPEVSRAQVVRVEAAARHLLQLIEEVLAFSRLEAGREEIHREEVELTLLAREVGLLVEPLAREKGLAFCIAVPNEPVVMETDARKVRQILVNLLSNAVKFTERGEVALDCRAEEADVVFTVHDTGIGIAREHGERIFDPFWQVTHSSLKRRVGGTGLGLSIVRRLARLLAGDVTFESTPGQGSTFTVRLPIRLERRRSAAAPEAEKQSAGTPPRSVTPGRAC